MTQSDYKKIKSVKSIENVIGVMKKNTMML